MALTKSQSWALQAIKDGYGGSPASLGQRMMDRPGAVPASRGKTHYKAQGYGRMGGAMMGRLEKMGFVRLSYQTNRMWHPTKATITREGVAALKELAS